MRYSQLGNGVISYGSCTPWGGDAMPPGYCGWYPFHGLVRSIESCMLIKKCSYFFKLLLLFFMMRREFKPTGQNGSFVTA